MRKENTIKHLLFILLIGAACFSGCGSKDVVQTLTPDERFEIAKTMFDNRDYLDGINEFTIITLQFPGSAVAGDAQFYIAESRFKRGEYLLASYEYQTLKRNMPASPRVPDAQYKLGLCFYMLSPKSKLDQQYTRRAIDEFQGFVEYYPNHELVADASEKIQELTLRLAKKDFDTAQLYATMEYTKSALFYYDNVIEKYHDTEFAPLAYLAKTELLISRKKFSEAKTTIAKFLDLYPNSVLRSRADKLSLEIDNELQRAPAAKGDSGRSHNTGASMNLLTK